MNIGNFFHALLAIAVLLLVGNIIKRILFSGFIIPSSLIAGFLALVFGPQLLGHYFVLEVNGQNVWLNENTTAIFKSLPAYLIVVVFAGLFLGKEIPTIKQSLNQSLPNLGFGYTIAIGQYVVGMLTAIFILQVFFDTEAVAGALIAVGFQGGHGTVAGLQSTFAEIGFQEGFDLGLGVATIGLVSAIVLGTIMSNHSSANNAEPQMSQEDDLRKVKDRPFGLQFAILGAVIALAWLLLSALKATEQFMFADANVAIVKYMPLFPIAMLVGLLVQLTLNKLNVGHWTSHYQINLLTNLSLDILIVAALGSLDLSVLAKNWQSILLLGGVGVAYSASVYFLFGPWFFKSDWKIRGIGELGQSMGTTAVGLLMLKQATAKPNKHIRPFSYKQPLYEPVVGGGIVTALAIPAIAAFGPKVFTGIMIFVLCVILTAFYFIRQKLVKP